MTKSVLALLLCLPPMALAGPHAIVIHGGAGTILRDHMSAEVEAEYRRTLTKAVTAGHQVLAGGGNSSDAVIQAVLILEDSPLFNAGRGAVFTNAGQVELDASIMRGDDLNAGAVTGVKRVRSPILLAEQVMLNSPHVMLMGSGAESFAAAQKLEMVDNDYFHTKRRRDQLQQAIAREQNVSIPVPNDAYEVRKFSTVGAVALDANGTIAAATSTGGMTNKRYGRIGDSPIIGAGTYADNSACGISATGHGEYFIRAAVAYDICARVKYQGIDLAAASEAVINGTLQAMGGSGGVIGIDPAGEVVYSFNTPGMYRASIDTSGQLDVRIFRER
ncbi:MAG: beta-aspartyl-peptidase [Proteobacteria bacterium]|nr:beta-aspartyl-peptidase [Pseudomonadota bacterium]